MLEHRMLNCLAALTLVCMSLHMLLHQCCSYMWSELNLSPLVLPVSLLEAYMSYAIPHIRICRTLLQGIVTFGQPSVEDLEFLKVKIMQGKPRLLIIV